MTRTIAIIMLIATSAAFADPSPFGLAMGKATVIDVKNKYDIEQTGINKYSNGPQYDVPVTQVDFDGLKQLTLLFNEKDILTGVLATLPKSQFHALHDSLSKKYKVVAQEIPFVGNSSAEYVDGSTVIILEAPHLSFDMSMSYLQKELKAAFTDKSKADASEKRKNRDSKL